jgi:hypothetical protein
MRTLREVGTEDRRWGTSSMDATFGVEPSTATMVGEWYLHSRSAHRDAQVIEA